MTEIEISNEPERHRYEAHDGDTLAGFAEYQLATDLMVLTHTEVDPAFEGRGVGSALAKAALEDVRERGLKALVICPFINSWIARHRDYTDVLYGAPPSRASD